MKVMKQKNCIPIWLCVFSGFFFPAAAATSSASVGQPTVQFAQPKEPHSGNTLHFSNPPSPSGDKKTDGLAIAVLVSGILSFLLFFPIKLIYGFLILGAATLVMGIFALRKLRRRPDLGGKWMVWLGMGIVVLTGLFLGLVFYALSLL